MSPFLVGALAGGVGVLLVGLLTPRKKCPRCGNPLPKVRMPSSGSQAMSGGWTCSKCGCEIDRRENAVG
jgi:hypothetical protein